MQIWNREAGTEAETTTQDGVLLLAGWLCLTGSVCFFTHCFPIESIICGVLDPSTSVTNQENVPPVNVVGHFLCCSFFGSDDFDLCQIDKELTNKK